MAAFTTRDGDESDNYRAKWRKIVADDEITKKVILLEGKVVGSVGAFAVDGDTEVTYWIRRGAEWALCWIADLRNRLWRLGDTGPLVSRPHLVFFLHDEVVVHTPAALADAVAEQATEAAATAGSLLFRDLSIDFPLNVSIVRSHADAGKPGATVAL